MTPAGGPGQGRSPRGRVGHPRSLTRTLAGLAALAALALLAAACGDDIDATGSGDITEAADPAGDGVPDPLVVGLIPNVAPDEQRARYQDFGDYLQEALGVEVELFVASDYAGVVAAMAADRLDLAYFGGVTYVQAEQQVDVVPLVTEVDRETGTREYVSTIVVREESDLHDLDDVLAAGGRFAMGDVASTSGSLYPRIMLVDAGAECDPRRLTTCPPLESVDFTGGHDAAAQAVLSGNADAAGLERRILNRLIRDGVVPDGALRSVAEIDVMGYPWVARSALGSTAHDAITQAFLDIDQPELLDLLRAESYEAVTPADYDEVRDRSAELGLLTPARS